MPIPAKPGPGTFSRIEARSGSEGQTAPVDALTIRGPHTPSGPNSAQAIDWRFLTGGSAQIRAFRDARWGTHLQFLTNAEEKGKDAPQVRLHISENGNVGIGTDTPTPLAGLDVTDAVAIRGTDIYPENIRKLEHINLAFLKESRKLFIGWNRDNHGETDFVCNRGLSNGHGGFEFWDIDNKEDSIPKSILRICANGDARVAGNMQVLGQVSKTFGGVSETPTPLAGLDVTDAVAIRGTDIYPENIQKLEYINLSFLKNTRKLFIGWNRSNEGETDFVCNRGISSGGGGFEFWDIDNQEASIPKSILRLCANGDVKIAGNLQVAGQITKAGGGFLVDHPLDPENKTLRHNFVESPENLCLYRGEATLDESGQAVVKMPDYFAALTKEEEATVTLTPIGKKPFPVGYEWNQTATEFSLHGEPGARVSYLVLADRDDPFMRQMRQPVEAKKSEG